jgi:crotonobetainyl-CoA:carnitine CoA-transferase CaiB-like acyl-CoA transferase
MVRDADVLTENYRRGTLEKLGLGYDVLSKENPGLIYCAVSGYGRDGPYGDKGGFDLIAQGFAGLMSITGEPGGAPVKSGNSVADINAGILAVVGILAAYTHKQRTGQGQVVETSLMEAALQQTYWHAAIQFATGTSPGPTGSAHILTAPYQAFHAKDGWLNIGGANQANWERIADVLGHPEWRDDPRFRTNSDRMSHLDVLVQKINAVLGTRNRAEWINSVTGVPVEPVHSIGRPWPTRRPWHAAWWSTSCTRRPGRRKPSAARCTSQRHPPQLPDRRRCWANTRAPCCATTAIPTPRSTASSLTGLSKRCHRSDQQRVAGQ